MSARNSTRYLFSLSTLQHRLSWQRTRAIQTSSMDDSKSENKNLQGDHEIIRGHAGRISTKTSLQSTSSTTRPNKEFDVPFKYLVTNLPLFDSSAWDIEDRKCLTECQPMLYNEVVCVKRLPFIISAIPGYKRNVNVAVQPCSITPTRHIQQISFHAGRPHAITISGHIELSPLSVIRRSSLIV